MDNSWRKSNISFFSDQWSPQNQTLCKKSIGELTLGAKNGQDLEEYKAVNYQLKLRLAQSTAFAIASYGSESWTISRRVQKKLNAFKTWTYRHILRVSWREKRTNEWVLQKLRTTMVLFEQITSRKLRFFGHTMRHDGLEKTTIQGKVWGMRGRGRPHTARHSDIEEWVGCKLHQASQLAEHRDRWCASMKATTAHLRANW